MRRAGTRIDWLKTLSAKADRRLQRAHLRYRPQPAGSATLHCIVLDCSASMLAGRRLALAKGLLSRWTAQMYRRRERLAVIGFSGDRAGVLRAPTRAVAFNDAWIAAIGGGGGTPAAAAIAQAERLIAQQRRMAPDQVIALWVLTDGRFAAQPPRPRRTDGVTVVDFEEGAVRLGRAAQLARHWQADCVHVRALLGARGA
ncbi:VWA domain-containing protein [Denitromonas iodatirespirans]|uniref:VWA domain-containing protein n=1 Tax=Denitromonas iodatirespirans TaxID=2795389 RepID=UPI001E487226|nr:VWA domain-containing protein [Denitromonas iodatirespirans]